MISRSRASSRGEEITGDSKEEEEGSDEPDAKRARVMTVGVDKMVLGILVSSLEEMSAVRVGPTGIRGSWADMADEEEEQKTQERRVRFKENGSSTGGQSVTDEIARSGGGYKVQDDKRSPYEVETELLKLTSSKSAFDVCEVFSPPRVVEAAKSMRNIRGGWSMDLSVECPVTRRAWDFWLESDRKLARALVLKDRPGLLILSPPCTLFSQLQNLHPQGLPAERDPKAWAEAIAFVDFAMELAEVQRVAGRSFVFEHPQSATSWKLAKVVEMMLKAGVEEAIFDMCQFGMVATDSLGEAPVHKTTRVMTNDPGIAKSLHGVRCCGGHRHVHLILGRPAAAAIYPIDLCKCMLRGYDITRKNLGSLASMSTVNGLEESEDLCDPADQIVKADSGQYWDDLKGEVLDPGLARKARQEEMEVFRMRDVYEIVPRSSVPRGKRVIGVRWVETNKGTTDQPKVRSRLVAQEFAKGKTPEDMYAPLRP